MASRYLRFYGFEIDGRGKYYPRVFFLNPNGSIDYEINNAGFSPMYHYYYYDADTLYDNMVKYLENHGLYDRQKNNENCSEEGS